MHTLYIDKPMKGHNLMQAIARVNRVYKDKPGGLVVDYLGIAADLKEALSFYSDAGGKAVARRCRGDTDHDHRHQSERTSLQPFRRHGRFLDSGTHGPPRKCPRLATV